MTIDEILDLLPLELTEDIYFQNIRQIIVSNLKDINTQLISKIQVSEDIFDSLDDKDCFTKNENGSIMHFMYFLDDSICSLGVKEVDDSFYVYYEVKSFNKKSRTIMIKKLDSVIVETKSYVKENGIYKDYESNVYYYDTDYNEMNVDVDSILDRMFSEEFGVSLELASVMRNDFQRYAKFLTILASEQEMKMRDAKLTDMDFLYFRSPWLVSDLKDFIEFEYNRDMENAVKKYLHQNSKVKHLRNMESIEKIILWIQSNMDGGSEIVISNNIYQNLVPLLAGEVAYGFDTKGFIIEKINDEYYLYKVHFMTNNIDFEKVLLSKDEAQELFLANSCNSVVDGLKSFFGINRVR